MKWTSRLVHNGEVLHKAYIMISNAMLLDYQKIL